MVLSDFFTDGSPDSLPVTTSSKRSRLPARRRVFAFLATAALSGVLFQLCTVALFGHERDSRPRPWWRLDEFGEGENRPPSAPTPTPAPAPARDCDVPPPHVDEPPRTVTRFETLTRTQTAFAPARTQPQDLSSEAGGAQRTGWQAGEGKDDMDIEQLRTMVSGTKGYFARDWSVGLGWNNVRYIIEAALLQSRALNRTLIIPSFVYARACEYQEDICSAYATLVDREGAVGWDKWNGAPLNTLAWHIPIEVMLDLPYLRRTHPVLLMSEYLLLQGLPPSTESLAGDWDRINYHAGMLSPSLYVIPNNEYDPAGVLRVDRLGAHAYGDKEAESRVNIVLEEQIGTRQAFEVWEARDALSEAGLGDAEKLETDEGLDEMLRQGGWGPIYTFQGAGGQEYGKTVTEPTKQIVSLTRCRGFVEDYGSITADVILLEGETHLDRKPGQMRFMSTAARDDFARIVLYDIRPIEKVRILADRIDERLREMVGGRMWMSAHMRRGDFVTVGLAHSGDLADHFSKIQEAIETGRQTLLGMGPPETFEVPDARVDITRLDLPKPEESQWFYLATDERSSEGVQYLRQNGALLIGDVLTIEDRRLIGWPLLLTDVLAVVEQAVLARSSFFVGYSMSSVAGGVVNQRATLGADPRTSIIE